jgi:ABC-2 type transport system ATP-binding protein
VSRVDLWWLIAQAAADGAAVVLSTTYLDESERAARVLALDAGRTLASGTPADIVAAVPGAIASRSERPAGPAAARAWRRGAGWRVWDPDGSPGDTPDGGPAPDLQDAVTALQVAQSPPAQPPGPRPPAGARLPGDGLTAPLARASGAVCRFGDLVAVDHVDLAVQAGEVVGLLGANGAGKTTLIRLLLGLLRPTAGTVALFGEPPSRGTRRRLGYVPQTLGLYEDLSPADNLAFGHAVFGGGHGLPGDLRAMAGVPVGQLPLGVQRRVAFAQALDHGPDLLVLDEPTSGVDPLARARLWETIRSAADAGAGALVTTHHMDEAAECDRLVVMAAGRVVADGTVGEIVGHATVAMVESEAWAEAFAALEAAGLPASLVGTSLRVPGASPADVERLLPAGIPARVRSAPATLEERFFQLVALGQAEAAEAAGAAAAEAGG